MELPVQQTRPILITPSHTATITNYASIRKEKRREPHDTGDLALPKGWTGHLGGGDGWPESLKDK